MKKLTTLMLPLFLCMASLAQTEPSYKFQKGNILLGGSLWFNASTTDNDYSTINKGPVYRYWNVIPELSYFLRDRFSIGFNASFIGRSTKDRTTPVNSTVDKSEYIENFILVGLNGRFYFPVSERFKLFTGLELMTGPGNTRQTIYFTSGDKLESKYDLYSNSATITGGLTFHLAPRFVLFGEWSAITGRWVKQKWDLTPGKPVEKNDYSLDFGLNRSGSPFNAGMYFTIK